MNRDELIELLDISSRLSKHAPKIEHRVFHDYTRRLLRDSIRHAGACSIRSARFFLWHAGNPGGDYERLPLVFDDKFESGDSPLRAAAEFLAYIRLSETISDIYKSRYPRTHKKYFPGVTMYAARSSVPTVFRIMGKYRKFDDTSFYHHAWIKIKDPAFYKTYLPFFQKLVSLCEPQIDRSRPEDCDEILDKLPIEDLRSSDKSSYDSFIQYLLSSDRNSDIYFDVKEEINLIKKKFRWPKAEPQIVLLALWLHSANRSDSRCKDLWIFPSPLNNESDVSSHGAIWLMPRTQRPLDFYKWQVLNREIFLRGYWSEKIIDTEKASSRSAGTSYMARNLSHNNGSHCIAYWISDIGRALCLESEPILSRALLKSKELFQYLQHRMDFLAEVSTSVPCSEISLDINIDILRPTFTDPLEGEKIAEIDNEDYKLERSALLEYIAQSENINLHQKIEVAIDEGVQSRRVSIPNGIVGSHAIYSILENFLRNAAKHYKGTVIEGKQLSAARSTCKEAVESVMAYYNLLKIEGSKKLDIRKGFPPQCEIDCVDNCTDIDQCQNLIRILHEYQNEDNSIPIIRIQIAEPEKDNEKYLTMTIWDMRENSCNHKIISELRQHLPESRSDDRLLSKNGELQGGGWGIKEMLISANFLRKNSTDKLYELIRTQGKESNDPPLIEVLCGNNGSDKHDGCCGRITCKRSGSPYAGRLGWRFHLRKPKDLLITGNTEDSTNIGELFGIDIKKIKVLQEELPHRMLLVSRGQEKSYKDSPYAPCRILEGDMSQFFKRNDPKSLDSEYVKYYEDFIRNKIIYSAMLPRLIFTGMGAERNYDKLFTHELTKHYGQAVEPKELEAIKGKNDVAIFYYHAKSFFGNATKEQWLDFQHNYQSAYFQDLSGGQSFNLRVNNEGLIGLPPLLMKHFLLEIIESAMTKVIIIDERVSTWASQKWTTNITLREKLAKMHIFALDVKLDEVTCDDLLTKLSTLADKKCHFFVVHQGVLEKIEKAQKGAVGKLFKDTVTDSCPWKIVDSGRGVQREKLEKYRDYHVRYVEISALLKMLDNFDKHAFVQTLFSSRNPIKGKEGV